MSDEDGSNEIDPLRDLFAHVQPRVTPPEADDAEIRRALFAEWDAITGRRVLIKRFGAAAAAAALIIGFGTLLLRTSPAPAAVVASVERVRGNVEVDGAALTVGGRISSSARIDTHSGQVALRLDGGGSLRLAPQTRLTFADPGRATLDAGALYFDSEAGAAATHLEVRTAFGTVRDVGTQLVARFADDSLEVDVRDGRVTIGRAADSIDIRAGERVSVTSAASAPRREAIATFGAEWEWAERLAPPFEIDGRPLIDFLRWIEAQTGRTLVFADAASEQAARDTMLSGTVDLEPLLKLAAVIATTDLDYSLEGERIVIRAGK
jgi:ferric-dicitrate binding protein FerR (iron transport regulator)